MPSGASWVDKRFGLNTQTWFQYKFNYSNQQKMWVNLGKASKRHRPLKPISAIAPWLFRVIPFYLTFPESDVITSNKCPIKCGLLPTQSSIAIAESQNRSKTGLDGIKHREGGLVIEKFLCRRFQSHSIRQNITNTRTWFSLRIWCNIFFLSKKLFSVYMQYVSIKFNFMLLWMLLCPSPDKPPSLSRLESQFIPEAREFCLIKRLAGKQPLVGHNSCFLHDEKNKNSVCNEWGKGKSVVRVSCLWTEAFLLVVENFAVFTWNKFIKWRTIGVVRSHVKITKHYLIK